jgi:hypothetical protein
MAWFKQTPSQLVLRPEGSNLTHAVPDVEMGDTSLGYDSSRKAMVRAINGLCEFRTIKAKTLPTHIFKKPLANGC